MARTFWKKSRPAQTAEIQTARTTEDWNTVLDRYNLLMPQEIQLYDAMREAIPVIDAAIQKLVRLTSGFSVTCEGAHANASLQEFIKGVRVGAAGTGLESFLSDYLDDLLAYGNAVGEIVLTADRRNIAGLYRGALENIVIRRGDHPLEAKLFCRERGGERLVQNMELVLFSALNPKGDNPVGQSLLKGLPLVSSILLKIFRSMGKNFDRVGNLRYAVTYKPPAEGDQADARERAQQIAREWSEAMNASSSGQVKDFVAIGDVNIRVIGADNQLIDTEVPVRQLLEQIVAKLMLPPFMLGLSWSTTERMSTQQADVLTSELEYYRRLLTPVIEKICRTHLRLQGYGAEPRVMWNVVDLQDAVELAQARLYEQQANQLAREAGEEGYTENIT